MLKFIQLPNKKIIKKKHLVEITTLEVNDIHYISSSLRLKSLGFSVKFFDEFSNEYDSYFLGETIKFNEYYEKFSLEFSLKYPETKNSYLKLRYIVEKYLNEQLDSFNFVFQEYVKLCQQLGIPEPETINEMLHKHQNSLNDDIMLLNKINTNV